MIASRYILTADMGDDELLAVSTLTGAACRVRGRLRALLERPGDTVDVSGLTRRDSADLGRLRRLGMFFDSAADEAHLLARLEGHIREYIRTRPSRHSLALTHFCFFRCAYCFETPIIDGDTTLTPEQVPLFFAGLKVLEERLGATAAPSLSLYGGEPLQTRTRAVVETVLAHADKHGVRVSVVTNGYYLHEFLPLFEKFRGIFDGAQVVLDGPRHVHDKRRPLKNGAGTFERLVANIQRTLDAGFAVRVRANMDRDNLCALPELRDYVRARGWLAFRDFRVVLAPVEDDLCQGIPNVMSDDEMVEGYLRLCNQERERGEFNEFESEKLLGPLWFLESRVKKVPVMVLPKLAYCDAHTGKGMCFGADGLIYPCYKALEDHEGHVGQFAPGVKIEEDRMAAWLNRTLSGMHSCRSCAAATVCAGGCAYAQLKRGLSMYEPRCPDVRGALKHYVSLRRSAIVNNVSLVDGDKS